ncbi:hypothetical protein D1007_13283 [Hordeum vulgare]|nr:hypothetical protein D1007_13283 [Hordeum vulgare]
MDSRRRRMLADVMATSMAEKLGKFELLNDSLITWNPWTEAHIDMFGLYQDIPPPVPRCIDEETHKMSNMGRSGVDWNAENIEWINQWNNEALQNIVPQQRTYDATTTEAYYNWSIIS